MGQVPHYTIIGAGRVARHMCHYLQLLEIPYQQWSRQLLPKTLEQALIIEDTIVLLLISDSALISFIAQHPCLADKTVIHFSGSLHIPQLYAAHPLMTFAEKLYDLPSYQAIPFVLEKDGPTLQQLLPGFNNPAYYIEPQQKALYHALCVASGNFTTLLWQHCFQQFEQQLQLPKAVLLPYLQQITKNLSIDHQQALTGPLARGDVVTMQKNLQALENTGLQAIYRSFCEAFSPAYQQELNHEYS